MKFSRYQRCVHEATVEKFGGRYPRQDSYGYKNRRIAEERKASHFPRYKRGRRMRQILVQTRPHEWATKSATEWNVNCIGISLSRRPVPLASSSDLPRSKQPLVCPEGRVCRLDHGCAGAARAPKAQIGYDIQFREMRIPKERKLC